MTRVWLGTTTALQPIRNGDTLRIRVPQHGKATAVVLSSARPETL